MTRWRFSRNQIRDYAVIDNEVYNLDKKVYYHQTKALWILSGIIIVIGLITTALFYKKIISSSNLPLVMLVFSVFISIFRYIIRTLLLPKDIENFITLEKETQGGKSYD